MDFGLNGKVAIVTGGGSHIGRCIAHTLAKEGAKIVIADIDEKQGKKVEDEIKSFGGEALAVKTDITNNDSVVAMVKQALDTFKQIDILVNNAGWTRDILFIEKPREDWEKEVAINLWGVINCTRAVLDDMVARKGGKIVTVASDAGRMGEFREAVYGACKGGVIALSKALARELGRYGININAVCPGATPPIEEGSYGEHSLWQDMAKMFTPEVLEKAAKAYPLRRLGKPEDVANMVAFLASDRASFITGQTISVSGGYSMM